ncbi:MAG: preprotein translocase subunit SecG [Bacteriovoracaceae bacterium]|nr:preprotein translocase subunit SecG [Bacteriovoracaceae bacterium]
MVTGLIILHVIICILLTTVVLLQFGKGAEVGAVMGSAGASQAIFSSSGKGNFFTKLTTFLAIAFMVNSIALTTLTANKSSESIFDNEAPVAPRLNMDEAPKADAAAPVETKTETKTEAKKQ